MLKFLLLAIASVLTTSAPSEGADKSRRHRGSCKNADGGKCTVLDFKAGSLRFKTSRRVKRLRFVPPRWSGQASYDLTFDGVAKDCSAETKCEDGSTVSCSATGTNTQCQSNATSVGCLTVDSNGDSTSGSASSCPK